MLQVNNLTMRHNEDLRTILNDFSIVLNDGDKAVIIGEEGNGKSTLLKWIYDQQLVEQYIEFNGDKVNHGKMGYLPQELPEEDKTKSVYEFLSEEELFIQANPNELGRLAVQFNIDVDFFYSDQKMGSLSGGEKVKIQIIRLILGKPTILLLDEPTNDIDIETLEWMEDFILEWPFILVYISHDETLIENTANMVIHLELVKRKMESRYTIYKGDYETYLESRSDMFDKQMQLAINDKREKRIRDDKYNRIYQSVEHAQNTVSRGDPHKAQMLKKKMGTIKAMAKRFEKEDEKMTKMPEEEEAIGIKFSEDIKEIHSSKDVLNIKVDELKTPDGSRLLAENLELSVIGPEKICIVGPNGSGKTMLMKRIAQSLLARDDIKTVYMPQNYEDTLDLTKSPVEYLSIKGDKEEVTQIRTYLGSLKYTADEMFHSMSELSGGQKAKVLFLKMILSEANVLVLDEPSRNFSPLSGPVIRDMLKNFPGAIISVSHDRKYIDQVCNKVYSFTKNGLQEVDTYKDIE